MKISVILPCYNEEENIARIPTELVPELKNLGLDYEIIVVDDCSRDRTVEIAESLHIQEVKIIKHEKNSGPGAAFKTGIAAAESDLAVFLDADFTFHPRYIKDALLRLNAGGADFVGGSPMLASYDKDIAGWRIAISRLANFIYSLIFGSKITCTNGFFRLYKTKDLKGLDLKENGFGISAEILFKLLEKKKKYSEIPAELTVRQFGESKLNYKKEMARHLRLLFKIIGWKIKGLSPNALLKRYL